jgi:SAM-dependent methyltransferase
MVLLERPCPICDAGAPGREYYPARLDASRLNEFAFSSRKVPEFLHYRLVQCAGCDVLYANPAPAPDSLAAEYEQAAYDSDVEATFASKTYAHYLATRILPKLGQKKGAIDIGTGNGSFLAELLDLGFSDVSGVEPSSAPIHAAPPRVRRLIRQGIFQASDFEPSSQSLVTCFQTVEHVPHPLALAKDMFGLLRSGGAAYFVSHDYRSLQAKVLRERSPILDIEHLQLFSAKSMANLLTRAGFKDVTVFPIANRYPLGYWLRLLPFGQKSGLAGAVKALGADAIPIPLRAGNLATFGIKP